eukprot:10862790-Heterocapsa_arctica.AAC.1
MSPASDIMDLVMELRPRCSAGVISLRPSTWRQRMELKMAALDVASKKGIDMGNAKAPLAKSFQRDVDGGKSE